MKLPSVYSPLDLFVEDFFDFKPLFPARRLEATMRTDIVEKDGHYEMSIELPGFKKEEINVEVIDGNLTIKAEHENKSEEKDDKGNIVRRERNFGSCSRSFYVGENLKKEDIKAKFENGVLCINIPSTETKREENKITIDVE